MKNRITRFILLSVFLVNLSILALSQVPQTAIVKVIVAPDHKDWTYKLNEEVKFSVRVLKYGNPVENVTIDYVIGPEDFPDITKKGVVLKNGTTEFSGTMKVPGFYRLIVSAIVDGKRYEGLATAAYDPEKIQPTVKEPADFDAFWTKAIADARKIKLDPIMTLVPERCTSTVNVYHISFQNDKISSRIYGMLAIPKKPGKYPALLKLPGGGVYRYYGDTNTAAQGVITLEIGVHGIPVNLDPQVYTDLSNGPLFYYYSIGMEDKDTYYFKRINVGCVKAIDFIFSLPEFNGKDLGVTGQSQGGDLSIVTAGLDKRVTYVAALSPGGCDATGFLFKRPSGGPSFYKYVKIGPKEIETDGYYDAVNFAKRITAPGIYSWGFNDVVCPPTSMYSAYNVITAPKELSVFQETGHWVFPEQWEVVYINIRKHLMAQ